MPPHDLATMSRRRSLAPARRRLGGRNSKCSGRSARLPRPCPLSRVTMGGPAAPGYRADCSYTGERRAPGGGRRCSGGGGVRRGGEVGGGGGGARVWVGAAL